MGQFVDFKYEQSLRPRGCGTPQDGDTDGTSGDVVGQSQADSALAAEKVPENPQLKGEQEMVLCHLAARYSPGMKEQWEEVSRIM